MASTASPSSSTSNTGGTADSTLTFNGWTSQQAGPLPSKRGEIGFVDGVHIQAPPPAAIRRTNNVSVPAYHPADRDAAAAAALRQNEPPPPAHGEGAASASCGSSTHSAGKRSIASFLASKNVPLVLGMRGTTILRLLLQLLVGGGTLAVWVITIQHLGHLAAASAASNNDSDSNSDPNSNAATLSSTSTATVFVHVAFSIAVLAQLLFLERCIFRLRAERYMHLHPGSLLPANLRRNGTGTGRGRSPHVAYAPWNRPPLPTYAAALAEIGARTGDVEDGLIAVPPPPAYGKTRGSRLLLSGFLSDELRAQARRARDSGASLRPDVAPNQVHTADHVGADWSRPVSYVNRDEEWELRTSADRARRLEQTLSGLEVVHTPAPSVSTWRSQP